MHDDDLPRIREDAATRLSGEALDTYSQDELTDRIALLETEIERVRAHFDKAADHRKFAETLFKPNPDPAGSD